MSAETLSAALDYAARGWPVLPLWPIVDAGARLVCGCSCGAWECDHAGKHPWCAGGVTSATTDAQRIRAGWGERRARLGCWPNVGIATGGALLVVDIDAPALGGETWARLVEGRARLDTVEALTGRGRHLYLSLAGFGRVPSSAGRLGPGVDIRADGGYVVAPPSLHVSGRSYVWEASSDPTDGATLAAAPSWLVELARTPVERGPARRLAAGEVIAQGGRNDALTRAACSWVARGVSGPELREAVEALNASACDPPLSAREVGRIVAGVSRRYRPGLSPRVLLEVAGRELRAARAERLAGRYDFKGDPAWWEASMRSTVPADPDAQGGV